MITPAYCVQMARYNAWQSGQIAEAFAGLDADELAQDRGAFFGSLLGTASHLVWGDLAWMARFEHSDAPSGGIPESAAFCPDFNAWKIAREATDLCILGWVEKLTDSDLQGELTWFSGSVGRDVSKPVAACAIHMFNHQTHHRGQIHAMLTALGRAAPVSDLVFMPDGPI